MTHSLSDLNNMSMNLYGTPYMPYVYSQANANGYTNYSNNVGGNAYNNMNSVFNGYGSTTYPLMQNYEQPIQNDSAKTSITFTASEKEALKDFYKESNSIVQNWSGLPMSVAMIGLMEQPQNMFHPINACKAIKHTDKIFDLSASNIKKLWTSKPDIMQDAYSALNSINRNAQNKFPIIQKWFVKPIKDEKVVANLNKIMKDALADGSDEAIIKATETLRAAKGCDGYIPSAFARVKALFTGKKYVAPTPTSRIANKVDIIDKAVAEKMSKRVATSPAASTSTLATGFNLGTTLKGAMKQSVKEGKTMAIFGLVLDLPKIISAGKNGGFDSALKQVAQSGLRSVVDGIGWTLGRAAGTAIGTKVGAALGTAICPGVGTAIGGLIGFVGGAVGSIVTSKLFHMIMPTDEATKLEAEKVVETDEGKKQLLTMVMQKSQSGEKLDPNVLKAAEKLALQYGAVA